MAKPLLELDDQELELDRQQHPEVAHIANTNSESQPPSRPAHTISQSECNPSDSQGQRQDLFDTFQLFKTYLDHKSVDFKSDILSEQDTLTKKFQVESNIRFKSEGNRIQFRFNEEILDGLHKLHKLIPSTDKSAYVAIDLITKLRERNKLIRIADNTAGGWATVREYESSGYADNEEDEKRIRQAENRALRSIKDRKVRMQPYTQIPVAPAVQTAPNPAYNSLRYPPPPFRSSAARHEPCMWDVCYICKQHGHWKVNNFKTSTNSSNQQTSSAAKQ
jgi:hypothetical protein